MKKSKITFGVIAAIFIVVCLAAFFLFGNRDQTPADDTVPGNETLADTGEIMDSPPIGNIPATGEATKPTLSQPAVTTPAVQDGVTEIKLNPNVTMYKVDKDPNEVIDRTDEYDPNDPEFTADEVYNYCYSSEGRVYRNDKVITIEIYDALEDFTHSISFGFITGGCNRFLYLNPTINSEYATHYAFHFKTVSDAGVVETIQSEDSIKTVKHYTVLRALDQRMPANYLDSRHPGTVWYTPSSLDGTSYVDCVVMTLNGDWIATIRIHIAKDPTDGSYSIVNLENKNLMQDDAEPYLTDAAIQYLYETSRDLLEDPEQIQIYRYTLDKEIMIDNFIMEYRDYSTGLYYDYFHQDGNVLPVESREATKGNPIIAVTYRKFTTTMVLTLYFEVYAAPTENFTGLYNYIGRDESYYRTIQSMQNNGYPGLN